MHIQPSKEDLIELTKLNPFDRFADGRPARPRRFIGTHETGNHRGSLGRSA
jgi:hypothetical protein